MQVNLKQKCFPGNLKNKFFYPTWQIFIGYIISTQLVSIMGDYVYKALCLLFSVWVLFAIGFVSFLVGGFVSQWVCLSVGGYVCQWVCLSVGGCGWQVYDKPF